MALWTDLVEVVVVPRVRVRESPLLGDALTSTLFDIALRF